MVHDFSRSKAVGDRYEGWFLKWFAREMKCETEPVRDVATDKRGIDGYARFPLQVKADERAGETGNAFVETWSDKERGVKGWAYTAPDSAWLFYLVPATGDVIRVDLQRLRLALPGWLKRYPERAAPNETGRGWTTYGVCVPLDAFRSACGADSWRAADLFALFRRAA